MDISLSLINLDNNSASFTQALGRLEGERDLLLNQLESSKEKVNSLEMLKINSTKAVELLHLVQRSTRNRIKEAFENTVTFALKSIYQADYKFQLEFTQRGNLGELHFKLKSPDNTDYLDLEDGCAGGSFDIISLALRFTLLQILKVPGFICLDEPTKMLSRNHRQAEYNFYQAMSEKLGRQLIIITHASELIDQTENKILIGE